MKLFIAYCLTDLKIYLRSNRYMMPVLGFPIMLYTIFGLQRARDPELATIVIGNFVLFAQLGVVFFLMGAALAQDKSSPWFKFIRLLPSGKYYLYSRLVTSLCLMIVVSLFIHLASIGFGAKGLASLQLIQLIVFAMIASIPFIFLSFTLSQLLPSKMGWPIISMLYILLAYIGGLWFSIDSLPGWLQPISQISPTYLASCFTLQILDGNTCSNQQLLYLLLYTFTFAIAAIYSIKHASKLDN